MFVITLTYVADLAAIDAAMPRRSSRIVFWPGARPVT
jgi:hypothetical protein